MDASRLAFARRMGDVPNEARASVVAVGNAIAFIDREIGSNLRLADIAAAVSVTPRALQYGFREVCGTTPMAYLRRRRLQYVRADLLEPSPTATVARVATQRGFSHLGRFAGYYREEFGETPGFTLRSSRARHYPLSEGPASTVAEVRTGSPGDALSGRCQP